MDLPIIIGIGIVIVGLTVVIMRRRASGSPAAETLPPDPAWTVPTTLPDPEPGWRYCALICTPVGDASWRISLQHYDVSGPLHQEKDPDAVAGEAVTTRRHQLARQGWQEVHCTQDGARLTCYYQRRA